MANNRKCVTCFKEYSYCPNCSKDASKPTWMVIFCSEKCKKIDGILSGHTAKRITDKEAKNQLKDIQNVNFILANNKLNLKHYEEIMSYKEVDKESLKVDTVDKIDKVVENVEENNIDISDKSPDVSTEQKKKRTYNRQSKK